MPRNTEILTLEELYQYCVTHDTVSFSAKDAGRPVLCQVNSTVMFDVDPDADIQQEVEQNKGLFYASVRVAHTLLDYNKFYIEEDDMSRCMMTLKNRPLLAHIHQLKDGSYDFGSHDKKIFTGPDGNKYVQYYEQQVGSFTSEDPVLEHDDEQDKTWVVARVAIPYSYTIAWDIIKAKGGECKVSCELEVSDFEFHKSEGYLKLNDFYFNGVTLLGSDDNGNEIGEGMKGARLVLDPTTPVAEDTDFSDKRGTNQMKFDELLKKYNKKAEDITFEYKDLSDEDLEKKFAEEFNAKPVDGEPAKAADPATKPVDNAADGNAPAGDAPADSNGTQPANFSVNVAFEISQEDVRSQIYRLLDDGDRANHWNTNTVIVATFDDRFIYTDIEAVERHFFAQPYTKNDTGIELQGEPYEVFAEYLTADEKTNLDTMRANYPALAEFKANVETAEQNAAKDAVFSDESYAILKDDEGFKDLQEHKADFSVDELKNKCDLLFAAKVKSVGFAAVSNSDGKKPEDKIPHNRKGFNFSDNKSTDNDNPYEGLFQKND